MSTAETLLLLSVPFGGGVLALWVLWLNRPTTLRAAEAPDSASNRADGR